MIRNTLEECLLLFQEHHSQTYAIKAMEQLGEWEIAAAHWRKIGRHEDARACDLIVESKRKGDAFRAASADLQKWADDAVEQEIMTKEEAIRIIYPQLRQIEKQIYT
jgi:hypothetical protein